MPRTVYIETVGCQMNVLDSELVIGALKTDGYTLTTDPTNADVLLFNTCSVREHAEEKTYSALGRVAPLKLTDPAKIVGVIGCMAQKDQHQIRGRAPYVDLIVGTGQLAQIPALVAKIHSTREPQFALSLGRAAAARGEVEASFESYDPVRDPDSRPTSFQAFVRIQIGCDKFCTYCVVPNTRGPEQSRDPDRILAEVRQLAAQGTQEVTLLGQTVNSYVFRHGDGRHTRFSDLLHQVHEVPGIARVKFVTNYPKDMTPDVLEAVRDLPKVANYLHVPAQSGCDDVLKRMKRGYTVGDYTDMLARIRQELPGVAVSSDFIVGFCGESEASFQKTLELTRAAKFKNSFIFKYSERPGTKAAGRFPDDIPEAVKQRRNRDLLEVQDANSLADHRTWIGRTVQVLVEGPSRQGRRQPGPVRQQVGRTLTDHIAVFDAPDRLAGAIVDVAIHDCGGFALHGSVVTADSIGATLRPPEDRPKMSTRIGLRLA